MPKNKDIHFDDFQVARHKAARFLRTSLENLDKLNLPYVQVGPTGRKRYRQSDLDKVKRDSIKQ